MHTGLSYKNTKKINPIHSPAKIKRLYDDWLVKKAKSLFKHKVDEYSKKVGVRIEKITIKNLKNR